MSTHEILYVDYDEEKETLKVKFRHPVDLDLEGGGRMATVLRVYRNFPPEMYQEWQAIDGENERMVHFFFRFMDDHDEEYPAEDDE